MTRDPSWLAGHLRDVPDFPSPGIVFKDLTPLLGDVDDVTGRTAKRLLEIAGEADDFSLPVTQEELAGIVGASRERVNKAIASFVRLGWIEQRDRRYHILDRAQLELRSR